jgi:hypothetical protein
VLQPAAFWRGCLGVVDRPQPAALRSGGRTHRQLSGTLPRARHQRQLWRAIGCRRSVRAPAVLGCVVRSGEAPPTRSARRVPAPQALPRPGPLLQRHLRGCGPSSSYTDGEGSAGTLDTAVSSSLLPARAGTRDHPFARCWPVVARRYRSYPHPAERPRPGSGRGRRPRDHSSIRSGCRPGRPADLGPGHPRRELPSPEGPAGSPSKGISPHPESRATGFAAVASLPIQATSG